MKSPGMQRKPDRPDGGDELKNEKNSRRWSDADKIYGDDGAGMLILAAVLVYKIGEKIVISKDINRVGRKDSGYKRMYKAENIDTDKALKAIDKSRVMQERASSWIGKERSYMEGLNKGLDMLKIFFKCTDYEKTEQEATYTDGVCDAFYELGKRT